MRVARVIVASAAGFLGLCLPLAAQDQLSARASFLNAAGEPTGTGTVIGVGEGVLIEMEVHGLPLNSWVAVHVHETGDCDPSTAYESAGEHFNPTGAEHGYRSERGPHVGICPTNMSTRRASSGRRSSPTS